MKRSQPGKPTVFVAESFNAVPPAGSSVSDRAVADYFEGICRSLGWTVLTGRPRQARFIPEKVKTTLADSQAVLGIFTRGPAGGLSPWVIGECAFALGYRHTQGPPHLVAGFRESGIEVEELGMLTAGGMEFPSFDRNALGRDRRSDIEYLKDFEKRIMAASGSSQLKLLPADLPYRQSALKKVYLIYRSGYATVHNIVDLVVIDPHRFRAEMDNQVHHRIWAYQREMPPVEILMAGGIDGRQHVPFFFARTDYHNKRELGLPARLISPRHIGREIGFALEFVDRDGPLTFKAHDHLRYEYAWGLPNFFPTVEEAIDRPDGDLITATSYCVAQADADHGAIERFSIELRFERDAVGQRQGELFSSSPFYQTSRSFGASAEWTQSRRLPPAHGEPVEHDFWYSVYRADLDHFDGRIRVMWRPSSRRSQLSGARSEGEVLAP